MWTFVPGRRGNRKEASGVLRPMSGVATAIIFWGNDAIGSLYEALLFDQTAIRGKAGV